MLPPHQLCHTRNDMFLERATGSKLVNQTPMQLFEFSGTFSGKDGRCGIARVLEGRMIFFYSDTHQTLRTSKSQILIPTSKLSDLRRDQSHLEFFLCRMYGQRRKFCPPPRAGGPPRPPRSPAAPISSREPARMPSRCEATRGRPARKFRDSGIPIGSRDTVPMFAGRGHPNRGQPKHLPRPLSLLGSRT